MYEIVGKQSVDYTNKEGNRVQGLRLYVVYEKRNVDGVATETFYFSKSMLAAAGLSDSSFTCGSHINVLYNKYGSVETVSIVD
jgi:hypothetical protein